MLTAIKEEPLMGLMVVMTSLYWSSKLPYLESNWRVFLSWDLTTFNREHWQATGNTREIPATLARRIREESFHSPQ